MRSLHFILVLALAALGFTAPLPGAGEIGETSSSSKHDAESAAIAILEGSPDIDIAPRDDQDTAPSEEGDPNKCTFPPGPGCGKFPPSKYQLLHGAYSLLVYILTMT